MKKTTMISSFLLVGTMVAPSVAQTELPCMLAGDQFTTNDRAMIVGEQIVADDLSAGGSSFFVGDVSANTAGFGPNVLISGDLIVGSVDPGPMPTVTGEFVTGETVEVPVIEQRVVEWGGEDIVAEQDEVIMLEPGSYSTVVAEDRATIQLMTGTYDILSLDVGYDATVVFDVALGPIFLNVEEAVVLLDRAAFDVIGENPNAINVYTNDTLTLGFDGSIQGNVTAQNGIFVMDRAQLAGCTRSNTVVEVGYDARVLQP